jgi:hypothetical protein
MGFWLAATAWLIVGSARRLRRLANPVEATIVTCGFLHLIFVFFLFGNEYSWLYYSAILICGMCPVVANRAQAGALAVLAVVGMLMQTNMALSIAAKSVRTPETAGMFATPEEAIEWAEIRDLGRRERILVFDRSGAGFVVFPELDSPRVWFLLRTTVTPAEIERVRAQIRAAEWLVLTRASHYPPPDIPEFSADLAAFRPFRETKSFQLLRRRRGGE